MGSVVASRVFLSYFKLAQRSIRQVFVIMVV